MKQFLLLKICTHCQLNRFGNYVRDIAIRQLPEARFPSIEQRILNFEFQTTSNLQGYCPFCDEQTLKVRVAPRMFNSKTLATLTFYKIIIEETRLKSTIVSHKIFLSYKINLTYIYIISNFTTEILQKGIIRNGNRLCNVKRAIGNSL
jgi:hypothetical protein